MHETRTLAQFVANTQYTDLPPNLVADCKIIVLDTFAAGFIGNVGDPAAVDEVLCHPCHPSGCRASDPRI
jgi:2-methylcitrate dehydratase PrpD